MGLHSFLWRSLFSNFWEVDTSFFSIWEVSGSIHIWWTLNVLINLGGTFASFTSIFYARWTDKGNYSSHGASGKSPSCIGVLSDYHWKGAIYSILSLLACVAPNMTFQLYGIIPISAWLAVSGIFVYDLFSTMYGKVCGLICLKCHCLRIHRLEKQTLWAILEDFQQELDIFCSNILDWFDDTGVIWWSRY